MDLNEAKIKADFDLDKDIELGLKTLYSTRAGTMPLDREFGIKGDFLGETMPVLQNQYAVEIMTKTEKYEPRVFVRQVTVESDQKSGKVTPVIYLERGKET